VTDLVPAATPSPLPLSQRVPVEPHRLSALDDLVRGFLLSKRSPKTRDAYAADLASWLTFCAGIGVDPLAAGIHHADAYLRLLAESGDPRSGRRLAPASIARRTSALHGFYRYAARQHAVTGSPFTDAERPRPDDEHATTRLSTAERRNLRAAARADGPRSDALITLLLTNGLRISEAIGARIDDLSITEGHRVLRYRRKGNRRTTAPLTAGVLVALDACIGDRT
jgi:integrase/recombinase XerD